MQTNKSKYRELFILTVVYLRIRALIQINFRSLKELTKGKSREIKKKDRYTHGVKKTKCEGLSYRLL